ncbi:hypothetical protein HMPREF0762_01240 [Slackia exigua ATCC 700122]|uniref:Uncharacterized protein n=1 Tax=Slackia exigua (strain ATCC 700122 / DSM 15923 / CIP 105133 / JCM 11022 / KCTC 5966 / S-7) TaxID=649764 RepID=D0WHJ9_SLAES|nr:hypothetical protein HMPREF0762_01240 [Slackia exigua ATCC 700122]
MHVRKDAGRKGRTAEGRSGFRRCEPGTQDNILRTAADADELSGPARMGAIPPHGP